MKKMILLLMVITSTLFSAEVSVTNISVTRVASETTYVDKVCFTKHQCYYKITTSVNGRVSDTKWFQIKSNMKQSQQQNRIYNYTIEY